MADNGRFFFVTGSQVTEWRVAGRSEEMDAETGMTGEDAEPDAEAAAMSVKAGQKPAPPARRRARRTSEEIRALILAAARALFAERGFTGATTREIARRAGVAEPLIFSNFGSKPALFSEAVVEPFNASFEAFLDLHARLPADREQRSAGFVRSASPFLRDNADLLHAMLKSSGEVGLEPLHALDSYFARAVSHTQAQYQAAGLKADVPPDLLVRYCFGMLAGAVLFEDWFFPDTCPSEAETETALARMVFKAAEPAA